MVRGDPATRQFVAFWVRHQHVVAGMNVNVRDVAEPIQALIRSGREVDLGGWSTLTSRSRNSLTMIAGQSSDGEAGSADPTAIRWPSARWGVLDVHEFLAVTAVRILEPFGVVAVPLAQLCRRGDLLAPPVEAGLVLGQPSRPDAVDQHPGPVVWLRLIVDPAHPYIQRTACPSRTACDLFGRLDGRQSMLHSHGIWVRSCGPIVSGDPECQGSPAFQSANGRMACRDLPESAGPESGRPVARRRQRR